MIDDSNLKLRLQARVNVNYPNIAGAPSKWKLEKDEWNKFKDHNYSQFWLLKFSKC